MTAARGPGSTCWRWAGLALVAALAGPAGAAEEPGEPAGEALDAAAGTPAQTRHRVLADHAFVVPSAVRSPLLTTRFALRQGAAYLVIPDVTVEGYEQAFDLKLAGVVETLELGVRAHPRFGVQARVGGQLTTGVDPDTAFFLGARAGVTWEVALVAVPLRVERRGTQLGVHALVRGKHGFDLTPSTLVDAILAEREETLRDVLQGDYVKYVFARQQSLSGGGGLALAQALHPRVGLQIAFDLRAGRVTRRGSGLGGEFVETLPLWVFGAGAAVDIGGWERVPLTVLVEYRYRLDTEGWGDAAVQTRLSHQVYLGGGLFYGGRPDLLLGVVVSGLLATAASRGERFVEGELVVRYHFD